MAQYAFESVRAEYADLWARMTVTKVAQANVQAKAIIANKARYKKVEARTRVKWFVIGCLHLRESGLTKDGKPNFDAWLHNGDRMRNKAGKPIKTVHKPARRPPDPAVSWEDGAYDALVVCEQLDKITDWGPERVAYAAEKFNGFGYRAPSRSIPSPYLWGGTSVQKPGKFIEDGVYKTKDEQGRPLMDSQIGAMAVLKQMMALDDEVRFDEARPSPPEPPELPPPDAPPPLSGKAIDTQTQVKPVIKSKTIWGGVLAWLSGMSGAFAAFFQKLDNPYTLAAFIIIVLGASVGAFLVIKGRIDVNKLVEHLSDDDTQQEAA
jgi:lysozyme family protein